MPSQEIADQIACDLTLGRYAQLTTRYSYPLPISHANGYTLAQTDQHVSAFYQSLHAGLIANGLVRVSARVTDIDMTIRERYRVWTDWTGHTSDGRLTRFAQTVCYKQVAAGAPIVHMLEFLRLELPDFQPFH